MENLVRAIFNKENQATYFDELPKPVMDRLLRFVETKEVLYHTVRVRKPCSYYNFSALIKSSDPQFMQKWKGCLHSSGITTTERSRSFAEKKRDDDDYLYMKKRPESGQMPDLLHEHERNESSIHVKWRKVVISNAPVEEQFEKFVEKYEEACVRRE